MLTVSRMDLNRLAREWLIDHHPHLIEGTERVVLAARPSLFRTKQRLRMHEYYRWNWNFQVHGKSRSTLKDFLLVRYSADLEVQDLFLVPFDEAISRKTGVVYQPIGQKKRFTRGWLDQYRLTLE